MTQNNSNSNNNNNNKGLTDTALAVLEKRYFRGEEDFSGMCHRVAKAVASAAPEDLRAQYEEDFFNLMIDRTFLPNSPCLMNAGRDLGQLSACFVLPVGDSMEEIFQSVKEAALIHQSGGGTGFSFSRLRQEGSRVGSTGGVASGPVSFMQVFNAATETIKQGGTRRGANMAVLRCDHPDVERFITCKVDEGILSNFNISVAITDAFIKAYEEDKTYDLVDPHTGEVVKTLPARDVFNQIVEGAWKNGEPGLIFLDEANRFNNTPWLGDFEATNPCGEQLLLPNESCNLGSINLERFVRYDDAKNPYVDFAALRKTTETATRFLDYVIDVTKFPTPGIQEATRATRKIGLGIMGLHDLLIQMEIPYASKDGRDLAQEIMKTIQDSAYAVSMELANTYGPYPAFKPHEPPKHNNKYTDLNGMRIPTRNAALTTIAPTGTLSMIADCSSGCEPYFSIVMEKHVLDGEKLYLANKHFERIAKREGFYSEELMKKIADTGTVMGHEEIPEEWQDIFCTAGDILPEDHIAMQAALQKYVCSSISKTINMPNSTTREQVKSAYLQAWRSGCKGLTVYRDGSRNEQVLYAGKKDESTELNPVDTEVTGSLLKRELLDTEECERHRVAWKGNRLYIMVSLDGGEEPIEIFTKLPRAAGINGDGTFNPLVLQERTSNWDTICRLTSLALRYGIPLKELVTQFDRSSYSMVDAAGIISRVLQKYLPDGAEYTDEEINNLQLGSECPDCGGMTVVRESGCKVCKNPGCGYSACG